LPLFAQRYAVGLRQQPVSHIASFLIRNLFSVVSATDRIRLVHELSAVVPLFGLFFLFSSLDWTPLDFTGDLIRKGLQVFESLVRRYDINLPLSKIQTYGLQFASAYAIVKVTSKAPPETHTK
jgi:hypothetical protein